MLTNLISNTSYSAGDWESLLSKSCTEISYKLSKELSLEKDRTIQLECSDSFSGLEVLLQKNGLKIFLNSLPSRKDFRLYCKVLEAASKAVSTFSDEQQTEKLLKKELFNQTFDEIWTAQTSEPSVNIPRDERKIDLKAWIKTDLSSTEQEADLLKKINVIIDAKEPELFRIDEKLSAIWDVEKVPRRLHC